MNRMLLDLIPTQAVAGAELGDAGNDVSVLLNKANSAEALSRDRRYSATIALTDVPDAAARIRADLYTSSGSVTVRFFTETECHRNTVLLFHVVAHPAGLSSAALPAGGTTVDVVVVSDAAAR